MGKAKEDRMDHLHKRVCQAYIDGCDANEDGYVSPAMLAGAAKFLKDNEHVVNFEDDRNLHESLESALAQKRKNRELKLVGENDA